MRCMLLSITYVRACETYTGHPGPVGCVCNCCDGTYRPRLPCNLFDRRRVAAVRCSSAAVRCVQCRSTRPDSRTLGLVLQYAASSAAVRCIRGRSKLRSSTERFIKCRSTRWTLVRRCITPLACRGTLLSVDAVSSAAVRARTLGSALQHAALVLRYAASSAAVCRDHTPQYASGPSARRCSALYQVPQCVPQCAASGAVVRCDR
jgi:hypothetical protein